MSTSSTTSLRILLVDDQPEILSTYRAALSGPEMQVVTASGGQEALKQVQLQPFSLIILDIDMPGMNGFEVCRRLKQDPQTKQIPVIFVTGNAKKEYQLQAASLGAAFYLTKPFDLGMLRSAIQRWAIR